jgi:hypothetical protein
MGGSSATGNMTFGNATMGGTLTWGYQSLNVDPTSVTGNYLMALGASDDTGPYAYEVPTSPRTGFTCSGNTISGGINSSGEARANWPGNTYFVPPNYPTTNVVFLLPNAYEANRASIVIYNWQGLSNVSVDLSSVVASGVPINIFNAQDFYGVPVYTGVYGGGTVSLPMTGLTFATPLWEGAGSYADSVTPATHAPDFAVFIVRRQGA